LIDAHVSSPEIARRAFAKADLDADGVVSRAEFVQMTQVAQTEAFGIGLSPNEAAQMFDALEQTGEGGLTIDDFTGAFERGCTAKAKPSAVRDAAEMFQTSLRGWPAGLKPGSPKKRPNTTTCVPFRRSPSKGKNTPTKGQLAYQKTNPPSPLNCSYTDSRRSPSMHWKAVGPSEQSLYKKIFDEYKASMAFRNRSGEASAPPTPGSPQCRYEPDEEMRPYLTPKQRNDEAEENVIAHLEAQKTEEEKEAEKEAAEAAEKSKQERKAAKKEKKKKAAIETKKRADLEAAKEEHARQQAAADAAQKELETAQRKLEEAKQNGVRENISQAQIDASKAKAVRERRNTEVNEAEERLQESQQALDNPEDAEDGEPAKPAIDKATLLACFDELDEDRCEIVRRTDVLDQVSKLDGCDGLVAHLNAMSDLLLEREDFEALINNHF